MAATVKHAPTQFPPPVDPVAEFIAAPQARDDERIEVGVAIVGGGPAGLAAANRLLQLLADDDELRESLGEVPVAVIEKGKACGAHNLSGAVMKPGPLTHLFPDFVAKDHPSIVLHVTDKDDAVWFRNAKSAIAIKPTPPNFKNRGNWVVSISQLCRWMAAQAEAAGAYVLTETAAQRLLVRDDAVLGVVTGDKGRGKTGQPLGTFEPGVEVHAHATVLAEGTWGHLTGAAIQRFDLAEGKEPPVWKLGVKEVWKVSQPFDRVVHFFGWPGRGKRELGEASMGGWIYPMGDEVSIGALAPLHTADATVSAHDVLQTLKGHSYFRKILQGGERTAWGAKAVQVGGFHAMPKLSMPGAVLVGESGGMFDMLHIKGIHLAIESGILAGEAIYQALKVRSNDLTAYEVAIAESEVVGKALYQGRNFAQLQGDHSFVIGGILGGLDIITKGRIPGGRQPTHRDAEVATSVPAKPLKDLYPKPDGKYYFDKLSSVFVTGNATRDDAPNHIRIQKRVPREIAETWKWMCPAGVYEIPDDAPKTGDVNVIVNYTNCVQCGAITARGGRLTPPEGGDGPLYQSV